MKKILVIGANSYIAKKFYDYIIQNKVENIIVDLVSATNGEWMKKDFYPYDVVIHLAAIVHIKEKSNMSEIYDEINHKLAVNVAKKAKESRVRQFIFISTAAVFGMNSGYITKLSKPNPVTLYGKSKLMAEMDIIKLKDKNFLIAILRPPMIYGEDSNGNYRRLQRLALLMPVFPKYHNKRSMLHIDVFSQCLIDLIENERYGFYYPKDDTYSDVCKLIVGIRKQMGKKTVLISKFNFIIDFLIRYNKTFEKIFGNYIYDMD